MSAASNRHRILEALRRSGQPLDDDRLSTAADVHPRQQVNQICRALEKDGIVRRYRLAGEKLVNELIGADIALVPGEGDQAAGSRGISDASEPIDMAREPMLDSPPGHSREQRDAERVMLDLLGLQLGVVLEPARIVVADGTRVEVDGADAERSVLVECWAHQGPPKVAQKHKVLADTLKLTWIATKIEPRPRLFLCLGDPLAARPFLPTSKSWAAHALQDLGVTIAVVDLPLEVKDSVRAAQQRQYR
ncbi:hypothetical protein AB0J80_12150 [Actinoplanes sp. NPDC049548]|uniref:hypothetical protein n=1 Tax=Actinoplanes sp. NPDC049548 TaxID=3155152 RepID=UPI003418E78F